MRLNLQGVVILIWVILSTFLCLGGVKLNIGKLSAPGPGLMPFLIGLFLGTVSIITLAQSLKTPKSHMTGQKGTDLLKKGLGKKFY
jgi:hypothetical protein